MLFRKYREVEEGAIVTGITANQWMSSGSAVDAVAIVWIPSGAVNIEKDSEITADLWYKICIFWCSSY